MLARGSEIVNLNINKFTIAGHGTGQHLHPNFVGVQSAEFDFSVNVKVGVGR
jgi:hypothetical protein